MLYNVLSITNNEYLDTYEPNMVVKTIQCKEIAPSWSKEVSLYHKADSYITIYSGSTAKIRHSSKLDRKFLIYKV